MCHPPCMHSGSVLPASGILLPSRFPDKLPEAFFPAPLPQEPGHFWKEFLLPGCENPLPAPGLFFFSWHIPPVQDQPSQRCIASVSEIFHRHGNIRPCMDGHVFSGGDDKYFICIPFSHGHGKTAADNISQYIVENNVRL